MRKIKVEYSVVVRQERNTTDGRNLDVFATFTTDDEDLAFDFAKYARKMKNTKDAGIIQVTSCECEKWIQERKP